MATLDEARGLLAELEKTLVARQPSVERYGRYYSGDHPLAFLTPEFRRYFGRLFPSGSLVDNWTSMVVDSTAERCEVLGLRIGEDAEPRTKPESSADRESSRVWQANEADAEHGLAILDALIAGRSYALVWGDPDDPETPTITWEHASQAIVAYEPGNRRRRRAALKLWNDGALDYADIYLPDEVWQFSRRARSVGGELTLPTAYAGAKWLPREDVVPNPQRNPMGVVPLVELPVKPRLLPGVAESEIAGVVPLQDLINMLWAHIVTASDFAAFPQRIVLGAEKPMRPLFNDQGVQVGEQDVPLEKFAVDKVLWLEDPNAKIGEFTAANLNNYMAVVDRVTGHIAAETRTPQHYLVGKMVNLSAEALKAAETGLVSKVRERQQYFGVSLREVFRLVALAQGDAAKALAIRSGSKVLWRNAESRSDAQVVDALMKLKSLDVPREVLWELYGFTPAEIQRMTSMLDEEVARVGMGDLAAALTGPKPQPLLEGQTQTQMPMTPEQAAEAMAGQPNAGG